MISYPPRLDLARLPTPVTALKRLSAQIGGAKVWVKHDELTGTELSGNKVRKLEFCLAQALLEGCDTLITCGGIQSNHCRATAVLGARLGLKVHLILRGERPSSVDGNLLMDYLAGAHIEYLADEDYHRHPQLAAERQAEYLQAGHRACFIPIGASDETGLWGYVAACEELQEDFSDLGFTPDCIVLATGSGGTQSGLIMGSALLQLQSRILAIAVCDDAAYFEHKVRADLQKFCTRYADLLPFVPDPCGLPVNTLDSYIGPGYARADRDVFETIGLLARMEGIFLDPVYTGKAFHGMLQEMRSGQLRDAENVLFIHTGGLYGNFPQREHFIFG